MNVLFSIDYPRTGIYKVSYLPIPHPLQGFSAEFTLLIAFLRKSFMPIDISISDKFGRYNIFKA